MRRANDEDHDAPGQDSFLDIVANIVGILILLVMVMGVRALHSAEQEAGVLPAVAENAEPIDPESIAVARSAAVAAEVDIRELIERVVHVRHESRLRDEERMMLGTYVAAAEEEIDNRRDELSVEKQRDFDIRRQLNEAQRTLDDLTREQVALLSESPDVEEVENLPTPLAQSVSGKELHLRLAGRHVVAMPVDELLAEFKAHAESNVWRLRDQDSFVSTVGPIEGFRLRYRLEKARVVARTPSGLEQQGTVIRLVKWELLPQSSQIGEPVEQSLLPTSDLQRALKRYPPPSTTVTVWIYPDSFDDFRRLKKMLFDLGFATAGRPLPEGVLIGGSPQGSRSAAQ